MRGPESRRVARLPQLNRRKIAESALRARLDVVGDHEIPLELSRFELRAPVQDPAELDGIARSLQSAPQRYG